MRVSMPRDHRRSPNDPTNPLRGYRMSMLAHGFRRDEYTGEWKPEEGSMGYGVVPLRGGKLRPVAAVAMVAVVLLIVLAVVIAAVVSG